MPARRLDGNPVAVRKNDVAGQDSDSVAHFVRHASLTAEEYQAAVDALPMRLTDMGPPLARAGEEQRVHAHGCVPLTAGEIAQIDLFIDRLESEYQAHGARRRQQYVVLPHCRPEKGDDGTVLYHRYSCGGFVIEAYRFVGIDLIATDAASLPAVGLDVLRLAYPDQQRALDNPRLREALGLDGSGPWPIVLPGYLLNSLRRTEGEIRNGPYRPQPGDEYFPARLPQLPLAPPGARA
jgi:hypothetical protein